MEQFGSHIVVGFIIKCILDLASSCEYSGAGATYSCNPATGFPWGGTSNNYQRICHHDHSHVYSSTPDDHGIQLFSNGYEDTVVACLAGFDEQIIEILEELQMRHSGKDIKVYCYMFVNCQFYLLGQCYTDLKNLHEVLAVFPHYFCMNKHHIDNYDKKDCNNIKNLIMLPSINNYNNEVSNVGYKTTPYFNNVFGAGNNVIGASQMKAYTAVNKYINNNVYPAPVIKGTPGVSHYYEFNFNKQPDLVCPSIQLPNNNPFGNGYSHSRIGSNVNFNVIGRSINGGYNNVRTTLYNNRNNVCEIPSDNAGVLSNVGATVANVPGTIGYTNFVNNPYSYGNALPYARNLFWATSNQNSSYVAFQKPSSSGYSQYGRPYIYQQPRTPFRYNIQNTRQHNAFTQGQNAMYFNQNSQFKSQPQPGYLVNTRPQYSNPYRQNQNPTYFDLNSQYKNQVQQSGYSGQSQPQYFMQNSRQPTQAQNLIQWNQFKNQQLRALSQLSKPISTCCIGTSTMNQYPLHIQTFRMPQENPFQQTQAFPQENLNLPYQSGPQLPTTATQIYPQSKICTPYSPQMQTNWPQINPCRPQRSPQLITYPQVICPRIPYSSCSSQLLSGLQSYNRYTGSPQGQSIQPQSFPQLISPRIPLAPNSSPIRSNSQSYRGYTGKAQSYIFGQPQSSSQQIKYTPLVWSQIQSSPPLNNLQQYNPFRPLPSPQPICSQNPYASSMSDFQSFNQYPGKPQGYLNPFRPQSTPQLITYPQLTSPQIPYAPQSSTLATQGRLYATHVYRQSNGNTQFQTQQLTNRPQRFGFPIQPYGYFQSQTPMQLIKHAHVSSPSQYNQYRLQYQTLALPQGNPYAQQSSLESNGHIEIPSFFGYPQNQQFNSLQQPQNSRPICYSLAPQLNPWPQPQRQNFRQYPSQYPAQQTSASQWPRYISQQNWQLQTKFGYPNVQPKTKNSNYNPSYRYPYSNPCYPNSMPQSYNTGTRSQTVCLNLQTSNVNKIGYVRASNPTVSFYGSASNIIYPQGTKYLHNPPNLNQDIPNQGIGNQPSNNYVPNPQFQQYLTQLRANPSNNLPCESDPPFRPREGYVPFKSYSPLPQQVNQVKPNQYLNTNLPQTFTAPWNIPCPTSAQGLYQTPSSSPSNPSPGMISSSSPVTQQFVNTPTMFDFRIQSSNLPYSFPNQVANNIVYPRVGPNPLPCFNNNKYPMPSSFPNQVVVPFNGFPYWQQSNVPRNVNSPSTNSASASQLSNPYPCNPYQSKGINTQYYSFNAIYPRNNYYQNPLTVNIPSNNLRTGQIYTQYNNKKPISNSVRPPYRYSYNAIYPRNSAYNTQSNNQNPTSSSPPLRPPYQYSYNAIYPRNNYYQGPLTVNIPSNNLRTGQIYSNTRFGGTNTQYNNQKSTLNSLRPPYQGINAINTQYNNQDPPINLLQPPYKYNAIYPGNNYYQNPCVANIPWNINQISQSSFRSNPIPYPAISNQYSNNLQPRQQVFNFNGNGYPDARSANYQNFVTSNSYQQPYPSQEGFTPRAPQMYNMLPRAQRSARNNYGLNCKFDQRNPGIPLAGNNQYNVWRRSITPVYSRIPQVNTAIPYDKISNAASSTGSLSSYPCKWCAMLPQNDRNTQDNAQEQFGIPGEVCNGNPWQYSANRPSAANYAPNTYDGAVGVPSPFQAIERKYRTANPSALKLNPYGTTNNYPNQLPRNNYFNNPNGYSQNMWPNNGNYQQNKQNVSPMGGYPNNYYNGQKYANNGLPLIAVPNQRREFNNYNVPYNRNSNKMFYSDQNRFRKSNWWCQPRSASASTSTCQFSSPSSSFSSQVTTLSTDSDSVPIPSPLAYGSPNPMFTPSMGRSMSPISPTNQIFSPSVGGSISPNSVSPSSTYNGLPIRRTFTSVSNWWALPKFGQPTVSQSGTCQFMSPFMTFNKNFDQTKPLPCSFNKYGTNPYPPSPNTVNNYSGPYNPNRTPNNMYFFKPSRAYSNWWAQPNLLSGIKSQVGTSQFSFPSITILNQPKQPRDSESDMTSTMFTSLNGVMPPRSTWPFTTNTSPATHIFSPTTNWWNQQKMIRSMVKQPFGALSQVTSPPTSCLKNFNTAKKYLPCSWLRNNVKPCSIAANAVNNYRMAINRPYYNVNRGSNKMFYYNQNGIGANWWNQPKIGSLVKQLPGSFQFSSPLISVGRQVNMQSSNSGPIFTPCSSMPQNPFNNPFIGNLPFIKSMPSSSTGLPTSIMYNFNARNWWKQLSSIGSSVTQSLGSCKFSSPSMFSYQNTVTSLPCSGDNNVAADISANAINTNGGANTAPNNANIDSNRMHYFNLYRNPSNWLPKPVVGQSYSKQYNSQYTILKPPYSSNNIAQTPNSAYNAANNVPYYNRNRYYNNMYNPDQKRMDSYWWNQICSGSIKQSPGLCRFNPSSTYFGSQVKTLSSATGPQFDPSMTNTSPTSPSLINSYPCPNILGVASYPAGRPLASPNSSPTGSGAIPQVCFSRNPYSIGTASASASFISQRPCSFSYSQSNNNGVQSSRVYSYNSGQNQQASVSSTSSSYNRYPLQIKYFAAQQNSGTPYSNGIQYPIKQNPYASNNPCQFRPYNPYDTQNAGNGYIQDCICRYIATNQNNLARYPSGTPVPMGQIALAQYTNVANNPNVFQVETDHPWVGLNAWYSNLKIYKVYVLVDVKDASVLNFMPYLKNDYRLDPEVTQAVAKDLITKMYGAPYVVRSDMEYKPYAVVYDHNNCFNGNRCNILWPTYTVT